MERQIRVVIGAENPTIIDIMCSRGRLETAVEDSTCCASGRYMLFAERKRSDARRDRSLASRIRPEITPRT
jgi:hypothetical protein